MIDKTKFHLRAFALCVALVTLSNCGSNDSVDPCSKLDCKNGGTKFTTNDTCGCECPAGFSGDNCEKKVTVCPITVECPIGKEPNPANDCKCE
jgi:hypothetical protein